MISKCNEVRAWAFKVFVIFSPGLGKVANFKLIGKNNWNNFLYSVKWKVKFYLQIFHHPKSLVYSIVQPSCRRE